MMAIRSWKSKHNPLFKKSHIKLAAFIEEVGDGFYVPRRAASCYYHDHFFVSPTG
jgi:hypothetical protein